MSKVLARLPLPSRSVGSGYADSVVSKHGPILGPCVKGTCPAPAAKQVSGVRLCRFSSVKAWTYIRSMCQRYLPGSRCQAGQWGQAMQIQYGQWYLLCSRCQAGQWGQAVQIQRGQSYLPSRCQTGQWGQAMQIQSGQRYLPGSRCLAGQWGQAMQIQ